MPKPPTPSKGRSLSLTEVKIFFLSLAVAGTLGIWGLLARQADLAAAATFSTPVPDVPPAPDQSPNTLVLVLPPLPTLIAPGPDPVNLNLPAQAPTAEMVSQPQSAAPAVQGPVKIFLGGSKPAAPRANRVVTVTRSS
jgi:hypothetical protein